MWNYQLDVLAVLLCLAALSINNNLAQEIEHYESHNDGRSYSFNFALTDGTKRKETGMFVDGEYVVEGKYQYRDPDGITHYVDYYADKTGYHQNERQKGEQPIYQAGPPAAVVASLLG